MKRIATLIVAVLATAAGADQIAHPLLSGPLMQDWSNTGLIASDNDWSNVPSIIGTTGTIPGTSATDIDPRTVTGTGTFGVVNVFANQTDPNTFASGGVAEFELANPTIALRPAPPSVNHNPEAPSLFIALNATGVHTITLSFLLRDLDGTGNNAAQQFAVLYRLDDDDDEYEGDPSWYVADATLGGSATLETPVVVTLPAAANNQAIVDIRIITTNANGSDEWVGVDDIMVSATPLPSPGACALLGLGALSCGRRRR